MKRKFAALLVGGSVLVAIIDIVAHVWIAFHGIDPKGTQTPAIVFAIGISAESIFFIVPSAGILLSIATAIEALWRRLRLAG